MLKCTTTEEVKSAVAWTLKFKLIRPKFRLKLSIANMLKCTTTEEIKSAVAWTLKFKLNFRLKLGLNSGLN